MVQERAHAKINLALDITGRRANGYHEVRMIMQTLKLSDELSFVKRIPGDGKGVILRTDSEMLNGEQQEGQDNLITKAARKLSEYTGRDFDVNITLNKKIPIAAGMAGGSADAAATLRGLNRLYELNLSMDELCEIGVKIGADVPFCVREGLYLAEGIGEVLTKLPALSETPVTICKPCFNVSTKDVYTAFDSKVCESHPDVDGMLSAISEGDINKVTAFLGNVLEPVTVSMHSEIKTIKEDMIIKGGAVRAMMSGSGPTVFGIFESDDKAGFAQNCLSNIYPDYEVVATGFYNPETPVEE